MPRLSVENEKGNDNTNSCGEEERNGNAPHVPVNDAGKEREHVNYGCMMEGQLGVNSSSDSASSGQWLLVVCSWPASHRLATPVYSHNQWVGHFCWIPE